MRFTYSNGAALAAAGMFILLGAGSAVGQTTNPNQTGGYPNTANPNPTYPGQGNINSGNPNARTGVATDDTGTTTSSMSHANDMRFAKQAAMGGLTEVELGKLATQKASNDRVKQFGQRMVDDHSKANEELKSIAAKSHMTLPTDLDAKHKAMVDRMSGMSGDQFDKAYVAMMVKDHDQDISEFQQEANSGANSDLRNWAGKTLPTLQEHDRMIKEIRGEVGSSKMSKK